MNFKNYNLKLTKFSRENRNSATKSEACLWKYVLSKGQMKNFQFHRQRPIGNYIADFVCLKAWLIIEVDGFTHEDDSKHDLERDNNLKSLGFTTLRFSSWEVLNKIVDVSIVISTWLDDNYIGAKPEKKIRKNDRK